MRERIVLELSGPPRFFSKDELRLFLDKAIWENVYSQVVHILAITRHKKNFNIQGSVSCRFRYQYIFRGDIFSRSFDSKDLLFSTYIDLNLLSIVRPIAQLIKQFLRGVIRPNIEPKKRVGIPLHGNHAKKREDVEGGIVALYMGKSISLNLDDRSDFFWLINSDLPKDKVTVVFYRADIPITDADLDLLDKNGIRYWFIGKTSPNRRIPCWGPAHIPKRRLLGPIGLLGLSLLRHPLSACVHYFPEITRLLYGFILWREFFVHHGIRLAYLPNDFDKYNIAIHSAIRTSGGVGVSNQFSNIWFSSGWLSSNAEVLFLFSPHYERFWKENGSILNSIVYTGYVTDHSFLAAKNKSVHLRNLLLNQGAKTIIAFFDENSSDDSYSTIGHQRVADLYSFLLQWIIQDKEIGVIFKPGYPKTLLSRISGCSNLINKAMETGRCLVVSDGKYVTNQYPSEVSQAADLAVGIYLAGTAVLESLLAGTPTLFLDLEKIYSGELYAWGRDEVIFDSLEGLKTYVVTQRRAGGKFNIHPKLAQWARERDPFRDGHASRRIGQYLEVLFNELSQGQNKEVAIEKANHLHRVRWGSESVSIWK
ncbi:MAG: hypothetical protein IPN90_01340 [Elusimicrobia bacterium]|nr:hypothetical protein [Elusimicrobiota bacterium]